LIQNFITIIEKEGKETLIFPRFHQRDVVRRIGENIYKNVGKNYLIQHSAGSGKSMTIA
jgi:type I restriction enzyme R subunit